ncbi:MAG: acetate--CoA ligase family protein [Rickettsiales bacterium]|jgi:acetyltransferase|nr:acetate--CoA ligase family protein [Rickettsiales bacterium]
MSIKYLEKFFNPKSIAIVGANDREGSVGRTVTENVLKEDFKGDIFLINHHRTELYGRKCYADVSKLPKAPDLAVVVIPAGGIAPVITTLGKLGCKSVVIISAGLNIPVDPNAKPTKNKNVKTVLDVVYEMMDKYGMRFIGPNCLGILSTHGGVNGSFSASSAIKGNIAMVSQSGAVSCSVIDWAKGNNIGFSHIISIGDQADVDFADCIEYLGKDKNVSSIVMYMETMKNSKRFLEVAHKVSRIKPIIVIKAGRSEEGMKAAASHTGAIAGSDATYATAFRRAGIVRVDKFEDLYNAIKILQYKDRVKGRNLAILTNGGGFGVMATDRMDLRGATIQNLKTDTIAKLDAVLPSTWSHNNPVDIIGDAPGKRYVDALKVLADAKEVDTILTLYCPTNTNPTDVASEIIDAAKIYKIENILTAWIGNDVIIRGRRLFNANGIPSFDSPESAIDGYMNIVNAKEFATAKTLPPFVDGGNKIVKHKNAGKVAAIFNAVLKSGRVVLSEIEAKEVCELYNIPVTKTLIAKTADEALKLSKQFKDKVVLKILSDDITHKSDVGGVVLNVNPADIKNAFETMMKTVKKACPKAKIKGATIQEMLTMKRPYELLVGLVEDPVFGQTVAFGSGGTSVEVVKDSAIEILPIDKKLAVDMINRTRISKLLNGYRDVKAVKIDAIATVIENVAKLAMDFPIVKELDLNPLMIDATDIKAVDARIILKK